MTESLRPHRGHEFATFSGGWFGDGYFGLLFEFDDGSKLRLQLEEKNGIDLERSLHDFRVQSSSSSGMLSSSGSPQDGQKQ